MSHLQRMEEIRRRIQSKKKQDEDQVEPNSSALITPSKIDVVEPKQAEQAVEAEQPTVDVNQEVFQNTRSHKKGQLEPFDDSLLRKHHRTSGDLSSEQKHSSYLNERPDEEEASAPASQSSSSNPRRMKGRDAKPTLQHQRISTRSRSSQQGEKEPEIKPSEKVGNEEPAFEQNGKRTPGQDEGAEKWRWLKKHAKEIELPPTATTEKPSGKTNAEAEVIRGTSPLVSGFGAVEELSVRVTQPVEGQKPQDQSASDQNGTKEYVREQNSFGNVEPEYEPCPTPANSEQEVQPQYQAQDANIPLQKPAPELASEPARSSVEDEEQIQPDPVELVVPVRKIERTFVKNIVKEQEQFRRAMLNLRRALAAAQKRFPDIAASYQPTRLQAMELIEGLQPLTNKTFTHS